MKKALLYINSAALVALVVGVVALYVNTRSQGDRIDTGDRAADTGPAGATGQSGEGDRANEELDGLRRRVSSLEGQVQGIETELNKRAGAVEGESAPGIGPEASGGDAGEEDTRPPPGSPADDGRPVTRGEVRKLVDERIQKKVSEWQEQWRSGRRTPEKKTIAEISKELNLGPGQQVKITALYKDLEREGMKILFDIEEDGALEDLKTQLREAEYDPELKDKLREKVAVNWTLYQNKITALYIRADSKLRKIMTEKQLKEFYKYDAQLDESEFPDIEKMFWGGEED